MKLICLPHAGGNKYSYRNLKPFIAKEIEMITLELPGRGTRIGEPLVSNLDLMAEDIYRQVHRHSDKDYMVYGHSMGALLGNLTLHKLHKRSGPLPFHFLVTGCSSPATRGFKKKLSPLSDKNFKEALKKLGGMPEEVLQSPELLNYVMPILRSDIGAIENHVYASQVQYDVPLTVISGTEESLNEEETTTWKKETRATFSYRYLPGNHFFINQHMPFLGSYINKQFKNHKNKIIKTLSI